MSLESDAVRAGGEAEAEDAIGYRALRPGVVKAVCSVLQDDTGGEDVRVVECAGCAEGDAGAIRVTAPGSSSSHSSGIP